MECPSNKQIQGQSFVCTWSLTGFHVRAITHELRFQVLLVLAEGHEHLRASQPAVSDPLKLLFEIRKKTGFV